VLLRAVEPLENLPGMARRRGTSEPRLLCAGPGRLTEALGITLALDGQPVAAPGAWVERGAAPPDDAVAATARIGITRAADWPLRFVVRGSPFVSGPAGFRPR
jgi:DNA-3-methyladenine glycosylase